MSRFFLVYVFALLPSLPVFADRLDGVNSFAYQLQNNSPAAISQSAFDLIVMDYSLDGSNATAFTSAEIQQIKDAGKLPIAYLSIGEAEDYRFYFRRTWIRRALRKRCKVEMSDKAPSWLELPNPDYCGNYKTRFWERSWQRIIFGTRSGSRKSYLDRIIDAGFSGVYLDIIDGYEYWLRKRGENRRRSAPKDMATFVIRLAAYARNTRGLQNFVVIPQNGALILSRLSAVKRAAYLDAIDAIGAEDTYYFGDNDEDNSLNIQENTRDALLQFIAAGKKVFAIDYLTDLGKVSDFKSRACADGFIPQASKRALDKLEDNLLNGCS